MAYVIPEWEFSDDKAQFGDITFPLSYGLNQFLRGPAWRGEHAKFITTAMTYREHIVDSDGELFTHILYGGNADILECALFDLNLDSNTRVDGMFGRASSPVEYTLAKIRRFTPRFFGLLMINPAPPTLPCVRLRSPGQLHAMISIDDNTLAREAYAYLYTCACDQPSQYSVTACGHYLNSDTHAHRCPCGDTRVTSKAQTFASRLGYIPLIASNVYRGLPAPEPHDLIDPAFYQMWTTQNHAIAFPPAFKTHQGNIMVLAFLYDEIHIPDEMWFVIMSFTCRQFFPIDYTTRITRSHLRALMTCFRMPHVTI